MDTNQKNNKQIRLKMGTFSTLSAVFVVAIALVANMVFQNLGIYYDLTPDRFYSISDASKEALAEIDEEIKIYTLFKTGEELSLYQQYLEEYTAYPNITVENVDPYVNIDFVEKYSKNEQTIPVNSIVVESGEKYKIILPQEMYVSTFDYYTASEVVESITVEYMVTNAIRYVAKSESRNIYFITGHNEVPLSASFKKTLSDADYTLNDLQLSGVDKIPDDASALFITTPLRDYTDYEAGIVSSYLADGGKAIFFIDFTGEEYANIRKIVNYYGVDFGENAVLEGDSNYLMPLQGGMQNPFAIMPVYGRHEITSTLENSQYRVMATNARPLLKTEVMRKDLTVEAILATSGAAYLKDLENYTTLNKEADDATGPFALSYAVKDESVSKSHPSKIVFTGTSAILADEYNTGANSNLMLNMFNWACERMPNVYIDPKVITSSSLNISSMNQVYTIGGISVVAVPAVIMVIGVAVWLRRRNK
ncbi:GldG family protein [Tyzzerella sp. OttesenSCG-928-J15]|nr:GldG family protein [Tyzzerella sp. OttesenSCG-928-J15]